MGLGGGFDLISRESLLLVNNVLLTVSSAAVFLGTLYPLFMDALGFGKLSVGPPYFDTVFAPIMAIAVFLMGMGPFARWRQASVSEILKQLWGWFAASLVLAVIVVSAFDRWSVPIVGGVTLGCWAILSSVAYLIARVRRSGSGSLLSRLSSMSRASYGMAVAHIGIGVFVLGVTMVKGYETTSEVRMREGDTTTVAGYVFRFAGIKEVEGPNYRAARATIEVTHNGAKLTTLYPEKRIYNVQTMNMTESAIDTGLFRDLYVALGEAISMDEWIVRVQHKPLVDWIWFGCLLMAFGGALAISDRRYYLLQSRKRSPGPAAAQAAN